MDLYYSFGNEKRSAGNYWEKVRTKVVSEGQFEVVLSFAGGMQQLQIYAQGYYADAYELSSLRNTVEVSENSIVESLEKILYDPMIGITPFYSGWANHNMGFVESGMRVEVRPSVADGRLCFVQERTKEGFQPKGIEIPCLYNANLRSLSDPRHIPSKEAKLVIEFYCASPARLELKIKQGEAGNPHTNVRKLSEYSYQKELQRDGNWQKLELKASDFTMEKGMKREMLGTFTEARALQLNIFPKENEHPEIGKIYWSN